MRKSRNPKYLENLAKTLIQRHQIPCELCDRGAHEIYRRFGDQIRTELRRMNPETRGVIAERGRSVNWPDKDVMPIYHAGDGTHLDLGLSGHDLVVEIATKTVVAKMYDILEKVYLGQCIEDGRRQLMVDEVRASGYGHGARTSQGKPSPFEDAQQ